jgi:Family of unknown function (DUF5317)
VSVHLIVGLSLLAGAIAGWLAGGSLLRAGTVHLRLLWLAPLALGMQVFLVRATGQEVPFWAGPLHVASYVLLLMVVLRNRRQWGMPVIGLGLALNALVIAANGGLMPLSPERFELRHAGSTVAIGERVPGSKDVLLPREATRLWWLSDTIVLPTGGPLPMVASPGDLVLATGLAATVYGLMRPEASRPARPALRTRPA